MNIKIKNFFKKAFNIMLLPITLVFVILIYFYKFCISPLLPKSCRFIPTCSTYFLLAIKEYGIIYGSFLGIKRILRCNPCVKGGKDFLKPNIKGNIKWIL